MNLNERVSTHFTLGEFLLSDYAIRHGINNDPDQIALQNIFSILAPGMERIRTTLNAPVYIRSGYRSPTLNPLVGGSKTSQHMLGLAADFVCPGFGTSPRHVAQRLAAVGPKYLQYDQLILEGGWTHVSFATEPRGQVLTAHFANGGVTYTPGLA